MKIPSLILILLCSVAACGTSSTTTSLNVLAAASLTESFTELEAAFEAEHPDVDVVLTFDSSAVLVEQLRQGIPGDVLATADEQTMSKAVTADVVDGVPATFATNTLTIATPPDNPAGIRGLGDLSDSTFAACVPAAPCGDAAQKLLRINGISATAATEEENVKGVLTKVVTGEVDAGLVYRTDALAAGDSITTVEASDADRVVNGDLIALLAAAPSPDLAREWIDLVTGPAGQRILASYGFGPGDRQ